MIVSLAKQARALLLSIVKQGHCYAKDIAKQVLSKSIAKQGGIMHHGPRSRGECSPGQKFCPFSDFGWDQSWKSEYVTMPPPAVPFLNGYFGGIPSVDVDDGFQIENDDGFQIEKCLTERSH